MKTLEEQRDFIKNFAKESKVSFFIDLLKEEISSLQGKSKEYVSVYISGQMIYLVYYIANLIILFEDIEEIKTKEALKLCIEDIKAIYDAMKKEKALESGKENDNRKN